MDFLNILEKLLPLELALIAAVFFYLLILFKKIAEKFIKLSHDQAQYIQQRLDVVEKTIGISDKAFDFHRKQIEALEGIATKQEHQLKEAEDAKTEAEKHLDEADKKYRSLLSQLESRENERTELAEAQMSLESAVRSEAISRLSHEILIPIQAIYATSENLLYASDLGLSKRDRQSKLEFIQREIRRLTLLMRNSMTFATEPSMNELRLVRCDLRGLLQDMTMLQSDYAKQKGISINLTTEVANEPLWILTSEEEAQLVLFNLISNAVKYSYSSSIGNERIVEITVQNIGTHYRIKIKNYGVGIRSDEVQNIFQAGYRGALSLDRNRSGMGIGLYSAKQIINRLQGDITISSEQVKSENAPYITTATVTFPKYEASEE